MAIDYHRPRLLSHCSIARGCTRWYGKVNRYFGWKNGTKFHGPETASKEMRLGIAKFFFPITYTHGHRSSRKEQVLHSITICWFLMHVMDVITDMCWCGIFTNPETKAQKQITVTHHAQQLWIRVPDFKIHKDPMRLGTSLFCKPGVGA